MKLLRISDESIRASLQTALIGEIYPEIRAVVYHYDPENKIFVLRYYLDREPNDDDYDSIQCVMTEVMADFRHSDFNEVYEECIESTEPINQLGDVLHTVYARKED